VGSLPLEIESLKYIFRIMMTSKMSGWFPLTVGTNIITKTIIIAISSYAVTSMFELIRVAKIPMDQALKNVE